MNKLKDVERAVCAAIMVGAAIAGVVWGLYWVVGHAGATMLRWLVVVLIVILPSSWWAVWRLATSSAREHVIGFERGLSGAQSALDAMVRGVTAAQRRQASAAPKTMAQRPAFDEVEIGTMRLLEVNNRGVEIQVG